MTPEHVRRAYAGVWYPRPAWRRWETIAAIVGTVLVLVVFIAPVWRWVMS